MTMRFIPPLEHTADGFTLRMYRPGDGPALQRAVVSSYEHLRPWMPWAQPDQSVEQSEQTCRNLIARYLLNEDFTLGIWLGDELAGGTGFHLRHGDPANGTAEIGMWISAAQAGHGLGTRVLAAMLGWGFTDWPWQRLAWHCDDRNLASARIAEKNGLTHEGTLRSDALDVAGDRRSTRIYAMLREDWELRAARGLA